MPKFDALTGPVQAEGPARSKRSIWIRRLFRPGDTESVSRLSNKTSLWFIFWTFLKIGSVAFGGFMSLISFIESIVVKRHKLISHEEMLDAISLANLLPGPQAVNVVAFVGYRLRGALGAFIATFSIILPSFFLVLALSYFYFQYGHLPALQKVFQGFIPAIAAIVLSVVWRMSKKTITGTKEVSLLIISLLVIGLVPLEFRVYAPLAIIGICGFFGYIYFYNKQSDVSRDTNEKFPIGKIIVPLTFISSLFLLWFVPLPYEHDSLVLLTLTFASMSLILFGGGYVFIPIIGSIVVLQYGWVSQQEFTDGIAMGQITPGPILISAAFIGFKVGGLAGSVLATTAIFVPPAILMITATKVLDFIKQSMKTQAAIRGIHCGVIGMILMAAFVILKSTIPDGTYDVLQVWPSLLIFVISLLALLKFRVDVIWVIPGAGFVGYLVF